VDPPSSAPPTETQPIAGTVLRPDAWLTAAEELVGYSIAPLTLLMNLF